MLRSEQDHCRKILPASAAHSTEQEAQIVSDRLRSHFADHVDFRLTTATMAARDSKWCCQGFLGAAAASFDTGCSGPTDILQQTCGTFWLRRGDAADGEKRKRELQCIKPCDLQARRVVAVDIEVDGPLKMSQSCGRLSSREFRKTILGSSHISF